MISIIHPSRGRPQKSLQTIRKWREMAENYIKVIPVVDFDDSKLPEYQEIYSITGLTISSGASAITAINLGAKKAIEYGASILIVVSDDTDCPEHWDTQILNTVKGRKDWILKTQDGTQPWIITMPIMDTIYYNRFGYIYHPEYKHCFPDTELTCVADITGRKIKSDLLFKHNHYSVTKEKPDEVSKRADATWDQGEKLFLERYKRNFGLPPGKPIEDMSMINWLKRKVR